MVKLTDDKQLIYRILRSELPDSKIQVAVTDVVYNQKTNRGLTVDFIIDDQVVVEVDEAHLFRSTIEYAGGSYTGAIIQNRQRRERQNYKVKALRQQGYYVQYVNLEERNKTGDINFVFSKLSELLDVSFDVENFVDDWQIMVERNLHYNKSYSECTQWLAQNYDLKGFKREEAYYLTYLVKRKLKQRGTSFDYWVNYVPNLFPELQEIAWQKHTYWFEYVDQVMATSPWCLLMNWRPIYSNRQRVKCLERSVGSADIEMVRQLVSTFKKQKWNLDFWLGNRLDVFSTANKRELEEHPSFVMFNAIIHKHYDEYVEKSIPAHGWEGQF
jgi:hypothetical protein